MAIAALRPRRLAALVLALALSLGVGVSEGVGENAEAGAEEVDACWCRW